MHRRATGPARPRAARAPEITPSTLESALTWATPPDDSSVWDRWDAMSPREQADGARASDAALVERYEGPDTGTGADLQITLGFLPAPVGLDLSGTLRLNEQALHPWEVASDDAAAVQPAAVPVLLEGFAGQLGGMLGFLGKPGPEATREVRTSSPDLALTLRTGEQVALSTGEPSAYDGTLALPAEAFLRLVFGRLTSGRTPDGVPVDGPLDLSALRAVFPGC